jgi:hypothetical protein
MKREVFLLIIFVLSLLLNVIGVYSIIDLSRNFETTHKTDNVTPKISIIYKQLGFTTHFEDVYFNLNDSIYHEIWKEAYKEYPEDAFLISTSYYYVTKQNKALKDINTSMKKLQTMYHDTMRVK